MTLTCSRPYDFWPGSVLLSITVSPELAHFILPMGTSPYGLHNGLWTPLPRPFCTYLKMTMRIRDVIRSNGANLVGSVGIHAGKDIWIFVVGIAHFGVNVICVRKISECQSRKRDARSSISDPPLLHLLLTSYQRPPPPKKKLRLAQAGSPRRAGAACSDCRLADKNFYRRHNYVDDKCRQHLSPTYVGKYEQRVNLIRLVATPSSCY